MAQKNRRGHGGCEGAQSFENSITQCTPKEHALQLADRGYRIFPLRDGDKRPRKKRWQGDATTNPELIRQHFARWEEMNYGVVTGSGIIVLDVDGETGRASLRELATAGFRTFTVRTPNDGIHYFFRTDTEQRNRSGFRPGLDIRGDGGYVVGPGSRLESGSYELLDDVKPANVPAWLSEALATRERHERAADGPIPKGKRNDTLFRLASGWRYHGAESGEILDRLRNENARCKPPLDDRELRKIAASVSSYKPGHYADVDGETVGVASSWSWTTMFDCVVHDARLGKSDLLAYWMLNLHSRQDGDRKATVTISQLARDARMRRETVVKAVNNLVTFGYVEKRKRWDPTLRTQLITEYTIPLPLGVTNTGTRGDESGNGSQELPPSGYGDTAREGVNV